MVSLRDIFDQWQRACTFLYQLVLWVLSNFRMMLVAWAWPWRTISQAGFVELRGLAASKLRRDEVRGFRTLDPSSGPAPTCTTGYQSIHSLPIFHPHRRRTLPLAGGNFRHLCLPGDPAWNALGARGPKATRVEDR